MFFSSEQKNKPQDDVNDELKLRLTYGKSRGPQLKLPKGRQDVYFNQSSTPEECKEWLKAKGFSDR